MRMGKTWLSFSSTGATAQRAAGAPFLKITFYEGKCFSGRKLEVCGTCSSFQQRGFPHRVNSIRVQSGAWVCFDHPELHGQQFVLEHGEYPHWQRWNGRGDRMGSCRPVGMHGQHYRIQLFEGSCFGGRSMELTEDCSCLRGRGWEQPHVNAVRVYGDGAQGFRFVSGFPGASCDTRNLLGLQT